MPPKPPAQERALIIARDQRRKYGSRLGFDVQLPAHIGDLENVTLFLEDGTLATIQPSKKAEWEGGKRYELALEGFATASEAETAGLRMAQALLLTAVSLNFALRLNYHSHEPPSVFDRTVAPGVQVWAEGYSSWPQADVLAELRRTLSLPLADRKFLLSMELFAAALLESNDRTRFILTVSALEPLADQREMESNVSSVVDSLCVVLDRASNLTREIQTSLRGRIQGLKRESVRQALKRSCITWFPDEPSIWAEIDRAYGLRSELLHEGQLSDKDIVLSESTQNVSMLLRRIYAKEYAYTLR